MCQFLSLFSPPFPTFLLNKFYVIVEPSYIEFEKGDYSTVEGSDNQRITINVIRTGNLNVTCTAHYRTAEVSFKDISKNATENKDYGKSEGDIVFDVGEVRKCQDLH